MVACHPLASTHASQWGWMWMWRWGGCGVESTPSSGWCSREPVGVVVVEEVEVGWMWGGEHTVLWPALTRRDGGGGGVEVGVESAPTWGEHARWAPWSHIACRPLAGGHATWWVWRWVWRGLVEVEVEVVEGRQSLPACTHGVPMRNPEKPVPMSWVRVAPWVGYRSTFLYPGVTHANH
ncbi:hypothetical protein K439DRAFT_1624903 [Ramaria rubella]|nr:hypothetical protein K439DRAFT_1624903 [Ramaria rubella]